LLIVVKDGEKKRTTEEIPLSAVTKLVTERKGTTYF